MTLAHADALIDAALTVQGWQRQGPYAGYTTIRIRQRGPYTGYTADRIRRHVSRTLKCYSTWAAIEAAIVSRLMGEAP